MYKGELVRFREITEEDIDVLKHQINDYELKKFSAKGIPYPTSIENMKKMLFEKDEKRGSFSFAVEDLKEKIFIGTCGMNYVDWKNRYASIGISITDKNYWGKGYGTDAVKLIVKFIFEHMNLNKVSLGTFSFNKRAIACYKKCGFKEEGVLRQEVYAEGQYYDEICMGILRNEYEELYK